MWHWLISAAFFLAGAQAIVPPADGLAGQEIDPTESPKHEAQSVVTSGPATSEPADREKIEQLIAQLGAREFKAREDAQRALAEMGESVLVHLLPHITSKNEEVAARVVSLLGTPRDPELRVQTAIRLIEAADPDGLEQSVHMLFKTPAETCDFFMEATRDARGILRVVGAPIREQFEAWRRLDDVFQRTYARLKDKDAEKAAAMRRSHTESSMYCAEAAYWGALEALEDYNRHPLDADEKHPTPRTKPNANDQDSPRNGGIIRE